MSHVIRHQDLEYGYLLDRKTGQCYGFKSLYVDYDSNQQLAIKSPYFFTDYCFGIKDGEIYVEDRERVQEVLLGIPLFYDGLYYYETFIERDIQGGMHLHPILSKVYGDKRLALTLFDDIYVVCFRLNDIVFFDGRDVSVKYFTIPRPDFLKNSPIFIRTFARFKVQFETIVFNHEVLYEKIR